MIWTADKIESLQKFVEKVKKMRSMQKEYFKTRKKDVLIASKAIEKEVDDDIENNKEWK